MNVTVLGSGGMADHMIVAYLQSQGHTVDAIDRSQLDVEDTAQVDRFLHSIETDFVINCVGLLVKACEDRPDRAALVNSWFPQRVAYCLRDLPTRLVHLSTDCVFDGTQGNYVEADVRTETNVYGRSKSLGEVNNDKDLTFRMSIIGPELKTGTGLLQWVLTHPDQYIPGWCNAWWNGITTLQLAKCIDLYIRNPKISGVYHLVSNNNRINKYDLLCEINQVYGINKTIVRTVGPKNINKVLIDTRCQFDFQIPDYTQQLQELKSFDPLAHMSPTTS